MSKTPIEQAAVFAIKQEKGVWKLLTVSSRSGKRWVIPKGIVDEGYTRETTAVMEAFEEAGIAGKLSSTAAGDYSYRKWGQKCHVTAFLFVVEKVHDQWPESSYRKRRWLGLEELDQNIDERIPRSLLIKITELINRLGTENGREEPV